MSQLNFPTFLAKRAGLALTCALPLSVISAQAQAANFTGMTITGVTGDASTCNIHLEVEAEATVNDFNGFDIFSFALGSVAAPRVHGIFPYQWNVGASGSFPVTLSFDNQGAFTPAQYSVRVYDTTTNSNPVTLPTVALEASIPQADLIAAGEFCREVAVAQRSPRNGTVGN